MTYLSFKPAKNVAFKLYFALTGILKSGTNRDYEGYISPFGTIKISRDGVPFVNATNSPVSVSTGIGYLQLTATEMNATVIVVSISYNANIGNDNVIGGANPVIIYTA